MVQRLAKLPKLLLGVLLSASSAFILITTPAMAQTSHFELELGYQWLDISGNEQMYRSQIDQDDGPVLRGFSYRLLDPGAGNGIFDRLVISAAGFGGSPSGSFRLDAGLVESYRLRLHYRHFEHYSVLPGLANPFIGDGIIPGQHTFERDQDMIDLELELLPGRTISPLIGYRWNRSESPRRTTFYVGEDEFQLGSRLDQTEKELRAGLIFTAGSFRGTLIQGWRDYESRDHAVLWPGAGASNNPGTVLGRDVNLDSLQYDLHSEAEAPVTTLHLTGTLNQRIRLTASYVRADYESETFDDLLLSGSLVSFHVGRFFTGLEESLEARTESPSWRGELRVEADLSDRISLDAGFGKRSRELEGWSLVSSLYLESANFSGIATGDLLELVAAETAYQRDEQRLDLRLNARALGPFRLWAGWSRNDQDLTLSADPTQISVPGGQAGDFERKIDTMMMGGAVAIADLKLSLDWQSEDADTAVVRTDFLDRSRLRLRLDWSYQSLLRVLATAERITADNRLAGVGYDGETDHYALGIDISPLAQLSLRLAYDSYETNSEILIRRPESFSIEPSLHAEDAKVIEADLSWQSDRWSVDAGYSQLDNDGSFAFELDRLFVRFDFDFNDTYGISCELESAEYSEQDLLSFGDFEADRIGVFFRWRQ